jgi:hypothetical protein
VKFGFDIDDTLINLREHAFELYKKKLRKDLSSDVFHAIDRVEIHEPFGLTDSEGKAMWEKSLEEIYFTDCPLFPGAKEVLQEIENEGHEIYYITARPEEYGIRTREWMKEKGFPVKNDRFFFGMKDEEKVSIIKKLDLDVYVDDKPAVLHTLDETSTRLIVKDQSYNQEVNLERFNQWHEFAFLIQGEKTEHHEV